MSVQRINYPASSTVAASTTALSAGLASSSTLVAGAETNGIDNYTTNNDVDHMVSGAFTVNNSVAVTVNTWIEVWVIACLSVAAGVPTYPDVFDGTDSAETVDSRGKLLAMGVPLASILVDLTTAGKVWPMRPCSVKEAFGGSMPPFYVLFVTHNTGQTLHTSGQQLNIERIQGQNV